MSSHGRRWQSYRRRKRAGHSIYQLELSDADVETFLEHGGYLMRNIEHDKATVLLALRAWLDEQLGEE